MIDLTQQNTVIHRYEFDDLTGNLIITFFVPAANPMDPDVEVGKMKIEPKRARRLFEGVSAAIRAEFPDVDLDDFDNQRTEYDVNNKKATTEFFDI